jgi:sulfur transfer complex TusBCD TusB component (DsrH family)
MSKLLLITGTVGLTIVVVAAIAGLVYYQTLKTSPQYSLALLVDAAKRGDNEQIDALVDTDAVVQDFMPQIMSKAVELYGRGLPPETIARASLLAQPLMPAVKDRARAELPRVIRERTAKYGDIPFFAMVIGAKRYLDISMGGGFATVNSRLQDHPLEMRLRRNGERWQVVALKDDMLATSIAQKIGQEIISVAANGGQDTANKLGIGNLSNMLREAEDLVR